MSGANAKVTSKATTVNPKDLVGNTKVSISKLPVIAVIEGAMAMMDGASKYGAYNWRDKQVIASIYMDAALRHLYCWFEGQEKASDSRVHHLGHAIACCAILLDAQATGQLVDDRPVSRYEGDAFLKHLNSMTPEETAQWKKDGRHDVVDPDWMERHLTELSEVIREKQREKTVGAVKGETITLSDEAERAIKRKPPTEKKLIAMLNSIEERDMPSSEQVRWMAAQILGASGRTLVPKEKKR